jgi:hypothetical protein
MARVLKACGVDVPKHVIDNGQKELARLNMARLNMPRKRTADRAGASDFDQIIGGGLIWSSRGAYDSPRTDRVHGGE